MAQRSPRVQKITNGLQIKLSADQIIDVVVGEIQEISVDTSHGAVVLPANTSFDDECIRDKRSALGAVFQKHFPNSIEQVQQLIKEKLQKLYFLDNRKASFQFPMMKRRHLGG